MAIRLGFKISGVTVPQLRSASPAVQYTNTVSINCVRNASGVNSGNLRHSNRKEKKSKEYSSYDRPEQETKKHFSKEYDTVEQYELEAAKPREKGYKTNEIYEFMTKLQRNQSIRVLPHLQPSNLKPYGSTDNIIFPEILKPRDWIKYPTYDQDEQSAAGSHEKHCQEDATNKREFSSFDKTHSVKSADMNDQYNRDYDTESQESKLCEKCSSVPWPSYSDSIKPRDNVLESNMDSMHFTQTRKLSTNSVCHNNVYSPPIQYSLNLTVKEPTTKTNVIKDPLTSTEIREPLLNDKVIEAKKRGKAKKAPESWDEYCPEEEIIDEKCIVPQKEKKLPRLIPKDCPCIEPPEPCDVPPLPRLNLEVCEPRPDCPQPCEDSVRADEDCWEYLEPATVDCRTIPRKDTACSKCKKRKSKWDPKGSCRRYSTSSVAPNLNMVKRQYSVFPARAPTMQNTIPNKNIKFSRSSLNWERWALPSNFNLFNNNSLFKGDIAITKRLYSTKHDNHDCCLEEHNDRYDYCLDDHDDYSRCHEKSKCPLPKFELPPNPNKNLFCKKECIQFCNDDCAKPNPSTACDSTHSSICCEREPTPYPSYSECVITYITPFTNETNYVCDACGRTPRSEEACCRKFSTYSRINLSTPETLKSDISQPHL